jgi:hypothetical protein
MATAMRRRLGRMGESALASTLMMAAGIGSGVKVTEGDTFGPNLTC